MENLFMGVVTVYFTIKIIYFIISKLNMIEKLLQIKNGTLLMDKNNCRSFIHPNGYTRVSICNCKYGSISHG